MEHERSGMFQSDCHLVNTDSCALDSDSAEALESAPVVNYSSRLSLCPASAATSSPSTLSGSAPASHAFLGLLLGQ